jgi:hypothetical protein
VRDQEGRGLFVGGEGRGDLGEVGVQPGALEDFHGSSLSGR